MALNINGTTGISGVDGSVSAPALTGTDSNTGITFPSADTIKFSTGGVERLSITNSGLSGDGSGLTGVSAGKILQVVSTTQTSVSSVSVASGAFGSLGPTVSITPSSSSNKVLITSAIEVSAEIGSINHDYRLLANGSVITAAIGDAAGSRKQATGTNESYHSESSATLIINFLHSANTTSAVTYSIQVSHSSTSTRTIYCNRSGNDGNASNIGRYTSTITAMEVAA